MKKIFNIFYNLNNQVSADIFCVRLCYHSACFYGLNHVFLLKDNFNDSSLLQSAFLFPSIRSHYCVSLVFWCVIILLQLCFYGVNLVFLLKYNLNDTIKLQSADIFPSIRSDYRVSLSWTYGPTQQAEMSYMSLIDRQKKRYWNRICV